MTLALDKSEICNLTGYTQPKRQVDELRAQGFWRARMVAGEALLERAHYEAVCRGAVAPSGNSVDTGRPLVRPIRRGKVCRAVPAPA